MFRNILSFEGRIRRTEYGITWIVLTIFLLGIRWSMAESYTVEGKIIPLLLYIPFFWIRWAQGAKRCDDLGNSGWFQLIPFYSLWLLFADGQPYPNEYGENPKGLNEDAPGGEQKTDTDGSGPNLDPNIKIRKYPPSKGS